LYPKVALSNAVDDISVKGFTHHTLQNSPKNQSGEVHGTRYANRCVVTRAANPK